MACQCQLLIEPCPRAVAAKLLALAASITQQIESKYSRYRHDNLCFAINNAAGSAVNIDAETHRLLQFGDTCYQLSGGLFDLTSGILRQVWQFDGSDNIPTAQQIDSLMPLIGWPKVEFSPTQLIMPAGMEIDFGGIGKEYAVDKVAQTLKAVAPTLSILVNFGGDIAVSQPKADGSPWRVGISTVEDPTTAGQRVKINHGGLATSGDTERFLLKHGVRYSHIINPLTGYATVGAPAQLTVAASTCLQAGLLSTLALLHGNQAEAYIASQDVPYWLTSTTVTGDKKSK
ncbi:FAD:protein FMN transferase [Ferrimonas lipolytica]|uniref:FAD:protein FMN transferase n=2 Tax=Ferrimonas lipolytica TaxID=2724191 RepID=A0A6H1UKJ7_9GAMM|nr:FAD:protein FMN transferase [Ferrimonas lipolytica]